MIIELKIKINIPNCLIQLIIWPVLTYRRIRFGYAFRRIPLTQGKFAIISPKDYLEISKHNWFAVKNSSTYYAARTADNKQFYMHRQITKPPPNMVCDHIDHNGLNNCRPNLRLCTPFQNACNRKPRKGASSKFKGVTWHKIKKNWQARIKVKGRNFYLGSFKSETEAAHAYDNAALQHFGQFAYTNFKTS